MASEEILRRTLANADGKPFSKYKGLENNFTLERFELIIDSVQNDRSGHTFMRVRVPLRAAGFPQDTYDSGVKKTALCDLILRRFWESARARARSPIPKTDGGQIFIPRPGQEILERGCVSITEHYIEARFTADLPSSGGKADSSALEVLIFDRISGIAGESMFYAAYKQSKLYLHIRTAENASFIRSSLKERGLAAFVAEGSVIPRREDGLGPMIDAVPFSCDEASRTEFAVPSGDTIGGWGIPAGFTAVAGPSRQGKSSLTDAIFSGVYNHIPGDGREYVISPEDAVFVASEEGRAVCGTDMSMFSAGVNDVTDVSVSSPVSEFSSVSEAVEMGSSLIIADEEYSNPCVVRRGFMSEGDGYVPFSEAGRAMARAGTSLILITGDETAVRMADNAFVMRDYSVSRIEISGEDSNLHFRKPSARYPVFRNIQFEKGRKEISTSADSIRCVEIGVQKIDVPFAAFFETAQTKAAADAFVFAREIADGSKTMREVCEEAVLSEKRSDSEPGNVSGMYHSYPRAVDLAAAIGRHPQLLVIKKG